MLAHANKNKLSLSAVDPVPGVSCPVQQDPGSQEEDASLPQILHNILHNVLLNILEITANTTQFLNTFLPPSSEYCFPCFLLTVYIYCVMCICLLCLWLQSSDAE